MSTDISTLLERAKQAQVSLAKSLKADNEPQFMGGLDDKLTSVTPYVRLGFLTLFLLIGGFGGWAATTDLAGAVVGPGTVVVASNVKKIQHPTGGVVGKIFVKNGDRVKAGEVLVRLDETTTRAQMQIVSKQMDELTGRQARLRAERDDAAAVAFPEDLVKRGSDANVAQILAGEKTLFQSRTGNTKSQKSQLDERITGLKEEIGGLSKQAQAKSREIELIGKELSGLEELEKQRLVPTSKMMALRREGARLDGERAQLQASAGSSKVKITEIEMQRIGLEQSSKSDIVKELRETEGKLVELQERRTAAEDQLRRIDIKSPVDGVVHQMTVFTVGGVVNTGEPLMMIVPEGDRLVVEARISPQDIDQARTHEEAVIRFPAFNSRTTPTISGRVIGVSADAQHEPQTNVPYFVARIELPDEELEKLNGQKLVPGMPAEVQITTTSRSALSYLVRPMEDAFSQAFKER